MYSRAIRMVGRSARCAAAARCASLPVSTIRYTALRAASSMTSTLRTVNAATPRLGMTDGALKKSLSHLQRVLADEFMLYVTLRNAHWAVQSPMFKELHVLFQDHYEHADGVFDEIAERIRTLGGQASIIPRDLEKSTSLSPSEAEFHKASSAEIVRRVSEETEKVIKTLRTAMKEIEQLGEDLGTLDYLGSTLRTHEKNDWMLRSHLGQ